MLIRNIAAADYESCRRLVCRVFDGPHADLVERLRAGGYGAVELIAAAGPAVIGHVLCSRLQSPQGCLALCALGRRSGTPPEGRRRGARRTSIARAILDHVPAMFVLGDPAYYARFGFDLAKAARFETVYPKTHFMVRELAADACAGLASEVIYPPPFAQMGA